MVSAATWEPELWEDSKDWFDVVGKDRIGKAQSKRMEREGGGGVQVWSAAAHSGQVGYGPEFFFFRLLGWLAEREDVGEGSTKVFGVQYANVSGTLGNGGR